MNWPLISIALTLGMIAGASIAIAFRLTDIRIELMNIKQAIYNRSAARSYSKGIQ